MLLDLSDVLSEHHNTIEANLSLEMDSFTSGFGVFPVRKGGILSIKVEHVKEKELFICGEGEVTVEIPCDRCLAPVETRMVLDFTKKIDLDVLQEGKTEDLDEANYINGHMLDVEQLVYNEMLIGWPTKTLCSEECRGICSICGQNLNQGACGCEDTGHDPRMTAIRDVFNNFKEV